MKTALILLGPTIVGWLVGAFACALEWQATAQLSRTAIFERNLLGSGPYLVLPAFLVVTLPIVVSSLRRQKRNALPISWVVHAFGLLCCGLLVLGPFAGTVAGFVPLIPYALVIALGTSGLLRLFRNA